MHSLSEILCELGIGCDGLTPERSAARVMLEIAGLLRFWAMVRGAVRTSTWLPVRRKQINADLYVKKTNQCGFLCESVPLWNRETAQYFSRDEKTFDQESPGNGSGA